MKVFYGLSFLSLIAIGAVVARQSTSGSDVEDRLTFQTHRPWSPRINLNADAVMAYGIDASLPERMETWRQHGYRVEVMTGVAWGQYQDYLNGQYDGNNHWDEAQTQRDGSKILHGGSKDIPYISPGEDYGRYLTVGIKRALDAGAQAIYLEEPEFWARGGYSESFKREWNSFYKEPWQAPGSSADAQYRASKLKYFLYRRALSQIFQFVKDYGRQHGRTIPCYVPTHSLINYSHWRIVSPESSLIKVGADGYIAQVWTGTARTPNLYEGRRRERTFETAFLEYGAMQNLVRASGRRVWYLNDPIEDDPNHDWDDYRRNWESTLTASLLQPDVSSYEIMPWPERIFNGKYPVRGVPQTKTAQQLESTPTGTGLGGFHRAANVERVGIPKAYETELQAVITALAGIKQPAGSVQWHMSGTQGVGVLVSDSMMFQRSGPTPSDPNLSSFYGLAMPLLKRGLPVEPVQIESAESPEFLKRYRLLLLTYEGQKPPEPGFHQALAQWVKQGGALLVVDDDRDPYLSVREWWNTAPFHYQTPRQHLFEQLGLAGNVTGMHKVGRGRVFRLAESPAALTYRTDGAETILSAARQVAKAVDLPWKESGAMILRRGPYVVAAGLDESQTGSNPPVLNGRFIDLFDPRLPEKNSVAVGPGSRLLLFDLDAVQSATPLIAAAACRVRDVKTSRDNISFRADGIGDSDAVVFIKTNRPAASVQVNGTALPAGQYQGTGNSLVLRFRNSPEPVRVEASFAK